MKRLKGFTLIELIVVIAIIAILALVLVPNMVAYIVSSKYNTANNRAAIVYNSAATYCADYKASDKLPNGTAKALPSTLNGVTMTLNLSNVVSPATLQQHIEKELSSNILSANYENTCCVVYIDANENVSRVLWAEDDDSSYVGAYPNPVDPDQPEFDKLP